jgi:hypothetical protein
MMKKVEERVGQLLNTKTPKEDLENMCKLQKEHSPNLTDSEAKDYVIHGLVKTYDDHELDNLWYQAKKAPSKKENAA